MVYYDSAALYIESATTTKAKITAIDAIITALLSLAATAATSENVSEYTLNDGLSVIKESYRGTEAILKSVKAYEQLKNTYLRRLNGSHIRLVDEHNMMK